MRTTCELTVVPATRSSALATAAGGHARGGLARRGALEHVAGVVEVVLEHPGEVGVARTHPRDRLLGEALGLHLHRVRSSSPSRGWRRVSEIG